MKGLKLHHFHAYLVGAAVDERLPRLLRLVYCGSYIYERSVAAVYERLFEASSTAAAMRVPQ